MALSTPAVFVATGTQLTFSVANTESFMAEVVGFDPEITRVVHNTSHLGTLQPSQVTTPEFGGHTKLQGKLDDCSITFECHWNPDYAPPTVNSSGDLTITFPNYGTSGTIYKWTSTSPAGSAICESISGTVRTEELVMSNITFQLSGICSVTVST